MHTTSIERVHRILVLAMSVALFCATTIFSSVASASEIKGKPPLRWAADSEGGAPYVFKDPKNIDQYIGFEVEIAQALEKRLGRKIEYVPYDFKSLVPGLKRGDFDFAMNGLEMTPDRIAALRFTRPYYIYTLQLVVRANDDRIRTLDDCLKLKAVVGTMEDTAAERLLDKELISKKSYGNQVEPYHDLELGRVDAVLLDTPIALYFGKPNPKLKFVGAPLESGYYGIAFRKESESDAQDVDAAIAELIKSGELKTIYQKWQLWDETQEKLIDMQAKDVQGEASRHWGFTSYFPDLFLGALVTIQITVLSMALAMSIGLPLAMSRLYGPKPLRILATVYVEFFRGIPVLLLLYFIYFGLPDLAQAYNWSVGLKLPPLYAAILGFGMNYAAYEAEIYRAGISSIPIGQWEAGASLGMTRRHTFFRIILPQAIRVIIPPMTNDFVALFKDTSVVSIIAVAELTKQYQVLAKSSLKYIEIGLVTAGLYLAMSVPLSHLSRYLEKRWGKGK